MEQPFIALQQVCNALSQSMSCSTIFPVRSAPGNLSSSPARAVAGKTTLLNLIGGLEPVNSGSIRVAGIDITTRRNLQSYYRNIVAFFFKTSPWWSRKQWKKT